LAAINRQRLAIALLAVVTTIDLYFYFVIYINSSPRDLIHAFPIL
jgi:hypothetical protein